MDQLNLQFKARVSKQHNPSNTRTQRRGWWAPVWRGLPVEPTGKHYRRIHCSLWLYLYLVIHANRNTGTLQRVIATIASDMGISSRTIRLWLARLKKHRYIETSSTGRALKISITKWKAIRRNPD